MLKDIWDWIWEKSIEAFRFDEILEIFKKGQFQSKFHEITISN